MELYIYGADMALQGVIDEITSLIWTRRYWACGEFKLLVPFTETHVALLQKKRLVMKRGDTEAGEIRFVDIRKNAQGLEEIEVQGRFITGWIGKRILLNQIVTTDKTQNILRRIVSENITNPAAPARKISNVYLSDVAGIERDSIEYASEYVFCNLWRGWACCRNAFRLAFLLHSIQPRRPP